MLIQHRDDRLRLVTQHDHGLLSGELAMAWRGVEEGAEELPDEVVLAVSLHDLAWTELDAEPRRNPDTGFPYDFLSFPPLEKYEAAVLGIDRVTELHPYAGVLVSLHHSTVDSPHRPAEFEEVEDERRLELLDDLEEDAPGPGRIHRDLEYLRLFDNLSLLLCLTLPGAGGAFRPDWLTTALLVLPRSGSGLDLSWEDESSAVIRPFPFAGDAVDVDLPYRDLPPGPFPSDEALREAWEGADEQELRIRLRTDRSEARRSSPAGSDHEDEKDEEHRRKR